MNEVDYGAQPELAHHAPAEDGQPGYLRVVLARAGAQPVHHGGSLCEQEQHDYQDEEEVAQEVGNAGKDGADGPGEGAGFHHIAKIDVREPQALGQALEVVQLPVQLAV